VRDDSRLKLRNRTIAQPLARERSQESTTSCATGRRTECGATIYFSSPNPAVVPIGLGHLGHEAEMRRLSGGSDGQAAGQVSTPRQLSMAALSHHFDVWTLNSAHPDDSIMTRVSSNMESGPAGVVDVALPGRPQETPACWRELGSGNTNITGATADTKPGLLPSCPPDVGVGVEGRGKRMQPPSNTAITRSAGAPKSNTNGRGRRGIQPVAVVAFWASQTSPSRLCQHSTACRHSIRSEAIVTSELTLAAVQEDFPNPRAPARVFPLAPLDNAIGIVFGSKGCDRERGEQLHILPMPLLLLGVRKPAGPECREKLIVRYQGDGDA